jgi:hypothetical protein
MRRPTMPKKKKVHELLKTIPEYAKSNAETFIATYGIDRAEIIAKLTLEKIRASSKRLEEKYGGK